MNSSIYILIFSIALLSLGGQAEPERKGERRDGNRRDFQVTKDGDQRSGRKQESFHRSRERRGSDQIGDRRFGDGRGGDQIGDRRFGDGRGRDRIGDRRFGDGRGRDRIGDRRFGDRRGRDRIGNRRFGDERRGRRWYQSFRKRFWSPRFIWPRVTVFRSFFTDIIPQLSGYSVPEALMAEIYQLQNMLAQQEPGSPLGEALRRRLVNVIERLLEVAPGLDVQSLFEGTQL